MPNGEQIKTTEEGTGYKYLAIKQTKSSMRKSKQVRRKSILPESKKTVTIEVGW